MIQHQFYKVIPIKSGLSHYVKKILYSRCFIFWPLDHEYVYKREKVYSLFHLCENQHLLCSNVGFLFLGQILSKTLNKK